MRIWPLLSLLLLVFLFSCKKDIPVIAHQLETGCSAKLNRFFFVNDSLAYLCGGDRYDRGVLLKSLDGGKSWKSDSIADKSLYTLFFFNAAEGIAAGYDAVYCETIDSARHFSKSNLSIYKPVNGLCFLNKNDGVLAFGNGFGNGGWAITHNGGADWNYVNDTLHAYTAAFFQSDSVVLVCGYGTIKCSHNGGTSFYSVVQSGDFFQAMKFSDAMHGCAVGYFGGISRTVDGGQSWQVVKKSNTSFGTPDHLLGVDFFDARHGVAVGESGVILRTTDGGVHWDRIQSFTDADLHDVHLYSANSGIVAGSGGKVFMFEL
ncbi:MAG: YCF48-related protein [Chitinophagales bacterium]